MFTIRRSGTAAFSRRIGSGECTSPPAIASQGLREQVKELSEDGLAALAEPFFDKGWIDAPVRPGKAPGAFSCSRGSPLNDNACT